MKLGTLIEVRARSEHRCEDTDGNLCTFVGDDHCPGCSAGSDDGFVFIKLTQSKGKKMNNPPETDEGIMVERACELILTKCAKIAAPYAGTRFTYRDNSSRIELISTGKIANLRYGHCAESMRDAMFLSPDDLIGKVYPRLDDFAGRLKERWEEFCQSAFLVITSETQPDVPSEDGR